MNLILWIAAALLAAVFLLAGATYVYYVRYLLYFEGRM
jgi:hypothetical protein